MSRVYLQAAVLAVVGLGLAVADRSMRPTPTVETDPNAKPPVMPAGPKGPEKGPDKAPEKVPEKVPEKAPEKAPAKAPDKAPIKAPDAPVPPPAAVDPASLPPKIELAPAFALFESGASFIDGRKPDEYAAGHVRDAVNLRNEDVQQNNQAWQDFFQNANLEGSVYVVYCYGKDCHEADQLRETLVAVGFKKVFVMEASFEQWKAAGHPAQ